jgi:hypothetical protein
MRRPDLIVISKSKRSALLFEFKYREVTLATPNVNSAFKQIVDFSYITKSELLQNQIADVVRLIVIGIVLVDRTTKNVADQDLIEIGLEKGMRNQDESLDEFFSRFELELRKSYGPQILNKMVSDY